jgi:radical SAM superfamily enzyme YgiQ (UPF0313 family)
VDDLERLPKPALELIHATAYRRNGRGAAVVVASRGCPLHCSYCALGGASAPPYRRRSLAAVLEEIDAAVSAGARFVDFEDENLSLDRRWFSGLLAALRRRYGGHALELRAMNGLYPPSLDEALIAAMKAAGFKTLNLSLGSSVPAQCRRFGRPDLRRALDDALWAAERHGLAAVAYVIAGAPGQRAEDSLADLLYLAARRVLAAISIYYPAPGSPDYERLEHAGLLPATFARMRSSALPLEDTTSRLQLLTLLRLGRILNFIKSLLDGGEQLPAPAPVAAPGFLDPADRRRSGRRLLGGFLHDGTIRGLLPDGSVYRHAADHRLVRGFLDGVRGITLRGAGM